MTHIEKALNRAKKLRQIPTRDKIAVIRNTDRKEGISYQESVYRWTKLVPVEEDSLLENRVFTPSSNAKTIDRYKLLRTQIFNKTISNGSNVLLVTSAVKGEGKTVTAINLAISIAKEMNRTVLLVDADLRHPTIEEVFGLNRNSGLSDYLLHDVPLPDLLVNPGIERLVILPGGRAVSNSTEVLGSQKMASLVNKMKRRYKDRYIVFDSSSILDSPDPLVLSSHVDGVLLVVEAGKTTTEQINEAIDLLKGKNILGAVLNKL
jgi:protein-tyrosine kinase